MLAQAFEDPNVRLEALSQGWVDGIVMLEFTAKQGPLGEFWTWVRFPMLPKPNVVTVCFNPLLPFIPV